MRKVNLNNFRLSKSRVSRGGGCVGTLSLTALGLVVSACGGGGGVNIPTKDTTPPTLESKVLVVSTPDGSPNERELTLTFSENVKVKEGAKVRLVRTSDENGDALDAEETVSETLRTVSVSGKNLVVRFTPSGQSKYKVVIEVGAIEDEAGNGFVVSGDAGTTEEVVPANAAPEFGDFSGSKSVPETVGGSVGTYGASDADGDELTYSLEGEDKGLFEIVGAGKVSWVSAAPIYVEGGDNEYKFVVVVVDGFGGEARHSVTVTVTEVTGPLPSQAVRLYDEDDLDTEVTGSTNKKKLTTLKVKVSEALSVGDSVEFFDDGALLGKVTLADVVAKGGDVTLTLDPALSAEKTYVLTAKVTIALGDNAGTSAASTSLSVTLDVTAPLVPTVSLEGGGAVTNKAAPVLKLSGLEEGATVVVTVDDGAETRFTTDGVTRDYRLTGLEAGDHKVVVKVIDKAGNESAEGELTFKVDTTPPTLTSRVAVVSTPDGSANERELTLTFSEVVKLKDGAKVLLVRTTDENGDALDAEETVAVADRVVSVEGKNLVVRFTPGRSKVKVVIEVGAIEDEAGNGFAPSGDGGTTEEVVPVNTAPVFGGGLGGSVSVPETVGGVVGTYGASDADGDTLTYSLEGEDKDVFEIVGAGKVSWVSPPVYASGGDNEYKFEVVVVDGFGGEVRHSVTVTVTEAGELLPPSKVELFDGGDLDTGVTGLTNKKNLNTLVVTYSEDLAKGFDVNVYDGNSLIHTATVAQDAKKGAESIITLTKAFSTDKVYSLTVKIEKDGKEGDASTPLSFTLDLTAPDAPTLTLLGELDGGSVLTSKETPTVSVGGLESGSRVNLYVAGALGTVIGTGGVAVGASSVQVAVEVAHKLGAGTHRLVAKEVDRAGNEGAASAVLSVKVDLTAPKAPSVVLLDAKEVGGVTYYAKAGDLKFTLEGLDADVGTERKIYLKEAGGTLKLLSATIDDVNSKRVVTVMDALVEKDGSYTVVGKVIDKAGNESEASVDFLFTVDRTAPDAPVLTLTGPVDGGSVLTSDTTPTVSVTGLESGSRVNLYVEGDLGTVIGTGVVAEGASSVQVTLSTRKEGTHKIVAKEVDKAGNESDASAVLSVKVDLAAPSAPTLTLSGNVEGGSVLTKDTTPTVSVGGLEAGVVQVNLYVGDALVGLGVVSSGASSVEVTLSERTEGVHSIVAIAVDKVGNESDASDVLSVKVDVTALGLADGDLTTGGDQFLTYDSVNKSLVITFDENVFVDTGDRTVANFQLVEGGTGKRVVVTGYDVTVNGKTVVLSGFAPSIGGDDEYEVTIATGVVKDGASNEYGGATVLELDLKVPELIAGRSWFVSARNKTITITFDETVVDSAIRFDTSKIKVFYKDNSHTVASPIAAKAELASADYDVSVDNGKVVITLTKEALTDGSSFQANLNPKDVYSVTFEEGAVTDAGGDGNKEIDLSLPAIPGIATAQTTFSRANGNPYIRFKGGQVGDLVTAYKATFPPSGREYTKVVGSATIIEGDIKNGEFGLDVSLTKGTNILIVVIEREGVEGGISGTARHVVPSFDDDEDIIGLGFTSEADYGF